MDKITVAFQFFWAFLTSEFVLSVFSGLVATGVTAFFAWLWVRRSFHRRVNQILDADRTVKKMREALEGANSFIENTQRNIHAELLSKEVSEEVSRWFSSELTNIRTSVSLAKSHVDSLSGSLQTLAKLGKEVK